MMWRRNANSMLRWRVAGFPQQHSVAGGEHCPVHAGERTPGGFWFKPILTVITARCIHTHRGFSNCDGTAQFISQLVPNPEG
jgi:hypothetical protein